jgi:DNA-binding LytR/AlgR family response regulator
MKINCLIVDDEPIARQIIQSYCTHIPELNIIASCGNALEAKAIAQQEEIDLIFLDINMPVLNGLAFLRTLKFQPQVIFTTAYKEYAVEAFDLAATDYLLKPFSLDRFLIAVDKVKEKLQPVLGSQTQEDYIFIKADGKIYKILYEHILYAEASGNYTKVVTKERTIMPTITFTGIEELLPASLFIRVHRSFIINKTMITHIEGNRAFINSTEIPIGSNYKDNFMKQLGL